MFSVLVALCLLCSGSLLASDRDAISSGPHHRFFPLTHISPERGKEFLSTLGLGTASRMPGTNALLVTAGADDLQKAGVILALVDAPEAYEIRRIAPASMLPSMPSKERIASAVGNLGIGSFSSPPSEVTSAKALIDVYNGSVWAIAPLFQVQDIALAIELGPEVFRQGRPKTGEATVATAPQVSPVGSTLMRLPSTSHSVPATTPSYMTERETPSHGLLGLGVLPPRPVETSREEKPLTFDLTLAEADAVVAALPNDQPGANAGQESLQPGQVVPDEESDLAIPAAEPNNAPEDARAAEEAAATPDTESPDDARVVDEPADYEPAGVLNGDRVIDLALPERLPVIQLLDLVGKYLNLDYIYDPKEIVGEVTLKLNGNLRGSMTVKELYLLLESVLKFQNLAMTRHRGNVVAIVPATKALEADPTLVGPDDEGVEAGDIVVTRVFELEHIDTESAQNLLDNMKLSIQVTPIAESGTLIVTAYAHRMARVAQLLDMVDRPGEPRKFRFRQLRYTMAQNLAEKVKALAEQLESVSVTVGTEDGSSSSTALKKLPGESDTAFKQRQARARAAAVARARSRTSQQTKEEVTKPGVYLDADERTNRILMIGVAEQLAVVEDLVDALDVEQQDLRSMKLYRIKHVDAEEVSKKLQELGIISQVPETSTSNRITDNQRKQNQTAAARARAAATAATTTAATTAEEISEEGPVEEPQVVVVESTNSLLVNATPEQHVRIETIISYVDSETLEEEIPYKIYPLENSSPDHLATVLQSLIQETTQNQDSEGKVIETVVKKKEDEITIVPDPNTYSLIVYASKKNQEWIASLVRQLDRRRPQVLIDVTLVEITKEDQFTYDLDLIESFPNLDAISNVATGLDTDLLEGLLASPDNKYIMGRSDGGDFSGYYSDGHVHVLLEAVKSKDYGRVLAKPKLLVNDNEAGTISTTETTYVETTSSIPVTSGTAGTDSTLIQTATDYTPYDAGITLDITPHISEGDLLRLDITLTRSDFATGSDSSKPPDTTTSEVTSSVTVPDGSTAILGGLLKLNQVKGGSKVPLLGDLPLVGGLFRSVSNEDRQSNLYVFVKAEVIRPQQGTARGMEDLEKLSERNRLAFEEHELEFQSYQSWPGIKEPAMSPGKVLEAQ